MKLVLFYILITSVFTAAMVIVSRRGQVVELWCKRLSRAIKSLDREMETLHAADRECAEAIMMSLAGALCKLPALATGTDDSISTAVSASTRQPEPPSDASRIPDELARYVMTMIGAVGVCAFYGRFYNPSTWIPGIIGWCFGRKVDINGRCMLVDFERVERSKPLLREFEEDVRRSRDHQMDPRPLVPA